MSPETALNILQAALQITLVVAGPLLAAALAIGVIVGLLQAATQINEPSIAFVAKLGGLAAVIFAMGPWMLARLTEFAGDLIHRIPAIVG